MVTDNPKGFNNAVLALLDACEGDRRSGKGRCPVCGKMALSVSNGDKGPVVIHCFSGNSREHDLEVIAKLRGLDLWPTDDKLAAPPEAEKRSDDARRQYAVNIWNGLKGSGRRLAPLLLDYLNARAIKEVPYGARIVLPIAFHDSGRIAHDPGMVLSVRDKNGVLQGIHTIWLNGNLTAKREAEPQRQSYGLIQGNFIALFKFEPEHAPDTLLIAEGVETALAASQLTGIPAIAACGKGFFKDLDPPPCANYVILVDNDEDGGSRKLAGLLAQRLVGCTVRIAMPDKPEGGKNGYDWNDALVDAGGDESKLTELGRLIREGPLFDSVMTREEKREIRLNALARLRLDDALGYEEQRVSAHNELGLRMTVLDEETARRGELIKAAQAKPPAPVDIELLEASARAMIASEDVLELFAEKFSREIAAKLRWRS
jgi:putative DNA primase/helicase